jgi:hypothetical protein
MGGQTDKELREDMLTYAILTSKYWVPKLFCGKATGLTFQTGNICNLISDEERVQGISIKLKMCPTLTKNELEDYAENGISSSTDTRIVYKRDDFYYFHCETHTKTTILVVLHGRSPQIRKRTRNMLTTKRILILELSDKFQQWAEEQRKE